MPPDAPPHLAEAPAWVMQSDSPACLSALRLSQFDYQKNGALTQRRPTTWWRRDQHLRLGAHAMVEEPQAHWPGARAPHPTHSRSHAPAPACAP